MSFNQEEIVAELIHGISCRSLYQDGHPRVRSAAEVFTRHLQRLRRAEDDKGFFLGVVGDRLVNDGRFLLGSTLQGRRLIQYAERTGSGGFLFRRDCTSLEIIEFFSAVSDTRDPVPLETARIGLRERGVLNVELSPPYEDPEWFGQYHFEGTEFCEDGSSAAMKVAIELYQTLFESVQEFHSRAERDLELDISRGRSVAEQLLKSTRGHLKDVFQLVQYPDFEGYVIGHSVRVALLVLLVAQRMSWPQHVLVELVTTALLHDVGKAKVPDDILYKRGVLTSEEREYMSYHAPIGAQILLEHKDVSAMTLGGAYGHHLRCDGRGYPETEKWFVRGRTTSLLQVCDVFEALTAVRPHQVARSPQRAFEIMLEDQAAFDRGALAALMRATGIYPPGSRVHLSSGEQGVVVAAGRDMARPQVEVTHDSLGNAIPPADMPILDLSADGFGEISISGLLRNLDSEAPVEESDSPAPGTSSASCC